MIRQGQWTTNGGAVSLSWNEPLTSAELDELEQFIAIWLRGLRRRADERTERERCAAIAEANAHDECEVAEQIARSIRAQH